MHCFQTILITSALGLIVACSAPGDHEPSTRSVSSTKFTIILKGGPAFDQSARNFRVREATSDFYWVVSDDFTMRLDPWFRDGDEQRVADEVRNRNTMLTYIDGEYGEILCGKDWEEDIVGDVQRTALSTEHVEATFRIELDRCTKNDELIPGKVAVISGSFNLPRTDG